MNCRGLVHCLLVATACMVPLTSTGGTLTWGSEERLTTGGTVSETGLNHGALAVGTGNTLTVAWAEQDGPNNNFRIYTRQRNLDGSWEDQELAVDFKASYQGLNLGAKFPALAYLPGDSLLMVWHDYRVAGINNLELFTKTRAPGEAWGDSTTELRLTTSQHPDSNGDNSYMPNLIVDDTGIAHVVWYDYRYDGDNAEILFKSRDGAWDTTPGDGPDQNISNNSGDSHFPALAVAPDGTLHAAWRDNTDGSFRIYHAHRPPGGIWTVPIPISPSGIAADGATLAVDGNGILLAAWADARAGNKAIYVRERSSSGTWTGSFRASPASGAEEPAIAVDGSGTRYLAWQDARISAFNREVFFQCVDPGTPWDSTGNSDIQLSQASGKSSRPSLLVAGNRVHVMWEDARHGSPEIYYRSAQAPQVGISPTAPGFQVEFWPNPFSSTVNLRGLPDGTREIQVLDVQGRRVSGIWPGNGGATWDGRLEGGQRAPPGIYFLFARMKSERAGDSNLVPLGKVVRTR